MSEPRSAVLIFAPDDGGRPGYGRRMSRLLWRRWLGHPRQLVAGEGMPAAEALRGAELGVVVARETAIPAPIEDLPALMRKGIVGARSLAVTDLPPVHTLREIEETGLPQRGAGRGAGTVAAAAFDPSQMVPGSDESLAAYSRRLLSEAAASPTDARFRALVFEEPADHPRPELVELLPAGRRLCDVGCSTGAAGAEWKRRSEEGHATGIESDPRAAAIASCRLDRVLEADAFEALEQLGREGTRFDAFLFADVLEHVEDPIRALLLALPLARPGARLVASVPNVAHLSLIRDLLAGRFDPLPAGLTDAGHLRWFSRNFLREALEEAGWEVEDLRGLPGAPAPHAEAFWTFFDDWEGLDHESLETYQWVAVARASPGSASNRSAT